MFSQCTCSLRFRFLGWNASLTITKSELLPQQKLQYLGVLWDPTHDFMWLPDKKVRGIRALIEQFISRNSWSREEAASFIGKIVFAAQVIPLGRLFCRPFHFALHAWPPAAPDQLRLPLPESLKEDFQWWHTHHTDHSSIFPKLPTHFFVSDASDSGCGAVLDGVPFSTTWRDYQVPWHINEKELFAITHFLKPKLPRLVDSVIQVQCDNNTVLSYLSKQGDTRSPTLYWRVRRFLLRLHHFRITLVPVRVPSIFNCAADALSRGLDPPEWTLTWAGLRQVESHFGPITIDLFASDRAHLCQSYVTLDARDPAALWIDAFTRPWDAANAWVFPPPFELPRVLRHLQVAAQGTFLLLTPWWPNAFWLPLLHRLSTGPPLPLLNLSVSLLDLRTRLPPPGVDQMELVVWKISLEQPLVQG